MVRWPQNLLVLCTRRGGDKVRPPPKEPRPTTPIAPSTSGPTGGPPIAPLVILIGVACSHGIASLTLMTELHGQLETHLPWLKVIDLPAWFACVPRAVRIVQNQVWGLNHMMASYTPHLTEARQRPPWPSPRTSAQYDIFSRI